MNKQYFDLQTTLTKYNVDWVNKMVCLLINAERNIGKSTSALTTILNKWGVDETKKLAILRNSDEQLKMFKQDFNEWFKGKYCIVGRMLYTMKAKEIENQETGDIETIFVKDQHCGYVASISAFLKMKSVRADRIRYVFYDEYNEISSQKDVYKKFISLFKTLERFNKVFFLMMGNRETPNNEFLVKWEIIPPKGAIKQDIYTEIRNDERIHHAVLELGTDQFAGLGNADTLSNHLASFDKDTDNYAQGGYSASIHEKVVPFNKVIKNTIDVLWGCSIDNATFAFGSFIYENETKYCLCLNDYAINQLKEQNLIIYSFDILGYQDGDNKIIDMDSVNNIMERLVLEFRNGNLFFDSYDVLEPITNRMIINGMFFRNQ